MKHPDRRPIAIAGASSGIGAATAVLLAEHGYPVALGARRTQRVEELSEQIKAKGGEAFAASLDVQDPASVNAFAAAAESALGPIEGLVMSSGINSPGSAWEVGAERAAEILDVNVIGAYRLLDAFAPGMVERQRGDLVFISSDSSTTHRPRTAAYNASKAGIDALVLTLQKELEGTGVRASVVRPGPTMTEMGTGWPGDELVKVFEDWTTFGLARHSQFLPAEALATAIWTIISAPRGTHFTEINVQPEAPVKKVDKQ